MKIINFKNQMQNYFEIMYLSFLNHHLPLIYNSNLKNKQSDILRIKKNSRIKILISVTLNLLVVFTILRLSDSMTHLFRKNIYITLCLDLNTECKKIWGFMY